MKEVKKKSSGIPIAIIVLVLALVGIGGWWFYQTSKPGAKTTTPTSNANTARPPLNMATAPPGAQPPNMLGSPTAIVTVEEFADYQCGSCAAAHPVIKEVTSAYAGNKNFKFIFRNYPLEMHDKAYDAAVAAEAAGMQGSTKFWQMQDQLFTNQHLWSANSNYRELFAGYAQKIGLDMAKFQSDVSGIQAKMRVDNDRNRGRALNISSTPTVIVNGRLVPFSEVTAAGMRRIIDAELQAAATPAAPANPANGPSAPTNAANGK